MDSSNCISVGSIKVLHIDSDGGWVHNLMPEKFSGLNSNFCSLGQSEDYYLNLKKIVEQTNSDFKSILFALKDAAFFPLIREQFEDKIGYINSLIRNNKVERLQREIPLIIKGLNKLNFYNFEYKFKPKGGDTTITSFKFNNHRVFPNRVYALIGKNGVGKTQFISRLPRDIAKENREAFPNGVPFFSKVIAISYSVFDSFDIPSKSYAFNYVYCGLKDASGDHIKKIELQEKFIRSCAEIKRLKREPKWTKILSNFLDEKS